MQKKLIVGIIIILAMFTIILDININGVKVFEGFFRAMETDSLNNINRGMNISFGESSSAERNVNNEIIELADGINSLYIRNNLGSIDIKGEDRENISLSYKLTVYAINNDIAQEFIEDLGLIAEQGNSRLNLRLADKKLVAGIKAVKVDYKILLPQEIYLNLSNKHGYLYVTNMKSDLKLKNSHDDMEVNNIDGNVIYDINHGSLYTENIQGKVELDSSHSTVDIKDIGNNLVLNSSHSLIRANDISADISANLSHGTFRFDNISGNIDLKSSHTKVIGTETNGEVRANLSHGKFDFLNLQNDLNIDGDFSEINIELDSDIEDYQIYSEVKYGDIETNLPFEVREVEDNTIVMDGYKGTGDIDINIRSEHDDVSVYLLDK